MTRYWFGSLRHSSTRWLGAAIVISFILRLPFLTVPLISDEGGYAYAAQRWFDGRGELYRDLVFDRPQGIFIAYGLIQHTLGTELVAIRLGGWLVTVFTLIVVWSFARSAFSDRAATLAAILFAVLAGSPSIEGFTSNAEVFMGLPAAACALILLHGSRNGWSRSSLLVAGVLAGTATLMKQSGIVMVPVSVAFVALWSPLSVRQVGRRWLWFGAGFIVILTPALVHGWAVGWTEYMNAVGGRVRSHSATSITLSSQLRAIADLIGQVWPLLVLIALPLYGNARRTRITQPPAPFLQSTSLRYAMRWPMPKAGMEAEVLLGLWVIGCLFGIAMGGNWNAHYVIQLIAPLSIWLGVLLAKLLGSLSSRARWELALPVAVVLLIPYSILVTTAGDTDAMSRTLFDRVTYPAQDEVAEYIALHTERETPIYVAFYQTSLYYLADRPAAQPRLYFWELQATPTAQDDLVRMVESASRPEYIVDLHQPSPFADGGAQFWEAVAKQYHLEVTIQGASLYRANAPDVQLSASVPGPR